MKYQKINKGWVIVLSKGDKIIAKLMEFCQKEGVNAGYFHGIGAVSDAEIAHFSLLSGTYTSKLIKGDLEIVSLLGDISRKDDIVIHAHIALSGKDMRCYGGHLKEARVFATCEIFLSSSKIRLNRKYDKEVGLNLIKLIHNALPPKADFHKRKHQKM